MCEIGFIHHRPPVSSYRFRGEFMLKIATLFYRVCLCYKGQNIELKTEQHETRRRRKLEVRSGLFTLMK